MHSAPRGIRTQALLVAGLGLFTCVLGSCSFSFSGSTGNRFLNPAFAFVVNAGTNSVSVFTVDPNTGALASISGSSFAAGNKPVAIALDSGGRFAYVADIGFADISEFTIDRSTGALIPVAGSPVMPPGAPSALAVDATGRFLYVADFNSNLSGFAIDQVTGALGFGLPTVAVVVNGVVQKISSVAVDPLGRFVVTANQNSNSATFFPVDPGTGIPGTPTILPAGTMPFGITVDPSGRFVYVTNGGSSNVSAYAVDAPNSTMHPVLGSPFAAGLQPVGVSVDFLGRFAYVSNGLGDNVSAYSIDRNTGALAQISGSPFAAGETVGGETVDPSGRFLYATSTTPNNNIVVFSINQTTGALTQIQGSPFPTGAGTAPVAIAIRPRFL